MVLKDFFNYKHSYYNSNLSNHKQEYFMKAIYNGLEVGLKMLENVSKKQDKLERELKQIKSEVAKLQFKFRK